MDKKQRFAVETLIPSLLGDALYKVICYYLKKDIAEMRESIKIDSLVSADLETLMRAKLSAFVEVMGTDKFRDMLIYSLSKIKKNRTDIVTEILLQHELAGGGERSTLMHDSLVKEFDNIVTYLKHSIKDKQYSPIYQDAMVKIQSVQ